MSNCEHLFYGKTMRCVHCNQPFTGAPSEPIPIDLSNESPLINPLDPRDDLVNRLLEHEKFKAASQMLWSRATVEQAVFTRAEIETDSNNPEVAVGLFDLLRVFQEILARHKEEVMLEIEREEVTMAEMIERLRNMVRSAGELNLVTFFERAGSRRGLVVAFLSVLELVRMSEISLVQRETFGEIIARATNPA